MISELVDIIKFNDSIIKSYLKTVHDPHQTIDSKLLASNEILRLSTENKNMILEIKNMYPNLSSIDEKNIELELAMLQYASLIEGAEDYIFENTVKFLN